MEGGASHAPGGGSCPRMPWPDARPALALLRCVAIVPAASSSHPWAPKPMNFDTLRLRISTRTLSGLVRPAIAATRIAQMSFLGFCRRLSHGARCGVPGRRRRSAGTCART